MIPINYDDNNKTRNVYIAVDTLASYFFIATCNIQDQPSRVFLVSDPEKGIQKLLDPQIRNTVTGGIVEVCFFIAFTQSPSPDALQPGPAVLPVVSSVSAASIDLSTATAHSTPSTVLMNSAARTPKSLSTPSTTHVGRPATL